MGAGAARFVSDDSLMGWGGDWLPAAQGVIMRG